MNTQTGYIVNLYVAPVAIPDPDSAEGVREEEQINLSLRAAADDKEYNHNIAITPNTIALKTLEEWQIEGKLVTVFSSSLRAVPFVHDSTKDKDGNPVKKYARAGRKVMVGQLAVETDAFVVFQSYDVQVAETLGLDKPAEKAHGDYIRRQAEYRKRSNLQRIEKAKQLVVERKAQIKEARQAGAAQSKKSA